MCAEALFAFFNNDAGTLSVKWGFRIVLLKSNKYAQEIFLYIYFAVFRVTFFDGPRLQDTLTAVELLLRVRPIVSVATTRPFESNITPLLILLPHAI